MSGVPWLVLTLGTSVCDQWLSWFFFPVRLTSVLVCKVFSFSIPLVEVLALDSHLCLWSVCLLTMERNPSWNFQSTQHHKLRQLLLNLTTPFWPLTQLWNTLIVPSWWTMRLSMTSAVVTWTSRDRHTRIWTDWLDRLCPPSQLHSVLMAPWMLTWPSFRYNQPQILLWKLLYSSGVFEILEGVKIQA